MPCILHTWDGCICLKCGKTRHQWYDSKCARCGTKCRHDWVEAGRTYYGGNDVNGWGPGGYTEVKHRCRICGLTNATAYYDDDA